MITLCVELVIDFVTVAVTVVVAKLVVVVEYRSMVVEYRSIVLSGTLYLDGKRAKPAARARRHTVVKIRTSCRFMQ